MYQNHSHEISKTSPPNLFLSCHPIRAAVFEEEDYQPMQYGYRLIPDVSEQRTVGMLREVEEDLLRRLRQRPPQYEVSPIFLLFSKPSKL